VEKMIERADCIMYQQKAQYKKTGKGL